MKNPFINSLGTGNIKMKKIQFVFKKVKEIDTHWNINYTIFHLPCKFRLGHVYHAFLKWGITIKITPFACYFRAWICKNHPKEQYFLNRLTLPQECTRQDNPVFLEHGKKILKLLDTLFLFHAFKFLLLFVLYV